MLHYLAQLYALGKEDYMRPSEHIGLDWIECVRIPEKKTPFVLQYISNAAKPNEINTVVALKLCKLHPFIR